MDFSYRGRPFGRCQRGIDGRGETATALCSLHHVIDMDWMREAFRLTRKDGSAGIDGATADCEANPLEDNLLDLLELIKSGRYRAPSGHPTE